MTPDPAPVIDLIEAFRRSKTMFAGVKLGVFDRLDNAPADAATLAHDLHVSDRAARTSAGACVGLGFLRTQEGRYVNQPVASAYLCRGSEHPLVGYILYSNDVLFRLWTYLEDAIREGGNRWAQAFGGAGGIFDYFFKSDEDLRAFFQGMQGFGLVSSPKAVAAFDLARFRRLVDLGGAAWPSPPANAYPQLQAVVFDLPRVVEIAHKEMRRSPRAKSRIERIAGDFFQDDLPEADLFALGQIAHDWSDDKIRTLLDEVYQRLPRPGRLYPPPAAFQQSADHPRHMLLCTEGKERTLSQYREMLEAAGFRDVQGCLTGAPFDAVLAIK